MRWPSLGATDSLSLEKGCDTLGLSSAATTKPQNHRRGVESGSLRGARPELGTSIGIRKSYSRGKGRSQLHRCSPRVLQCRGPAAGPPSPDPHPLGDQRRCKLLEKLCPDPTLIKSSDLVPSGTLPSNLENQGGRLAAGPPRFQSTLWISVLRNTQPLGRNNSVASFWALSANTNFLSPGPAPVSQL